MCRESLINFEKYELSEDSTIFSKSKNRNMKPIFNGGDYLQVNLQCIDGKKRQFRWHRVIWYYFNGDIPQGMEVNHIDENPSNNALSNLNLLTHKENINWGTHNEKASQARLNHPNLSKQVAQINRETGEVITIFPSMKEVQRQLGFNQSNILKACKGGYFSKSKNKWVNITQAYGFGWRYV